MTLERLTQITSVGISSGITLSSATLTGVTTLTTLSAGGDIDAVNGTFSGDLNVAGTLTYEDVTNIDSIGIITARSGLHVTGGSVGIGTDNPDVALHILSNTTGFKVQRDTESLSINPNYAGQSHCALELTNGLSIRTGSGSQNERLRITNTGNTGIGTTNPDRPLHILSSNNAPLKIDSSDSTQASIAFALNGTDHWYTGLDFNANGGTDFFVYDASATTNRLFIDGSTGAIGINTNAGYNGGQVTIDGSLTLLKQTAASFYSDSAFIDYDKGTRALRLCSGNQTGVGNSSVIVFNTIKNGSVIEASRIDDLGNIKLPYQVSFFQRNMDGSYFNSGTLRSGDNDHNIGSHYDTTTGIFTAPVAGVYMFGCGVLVNAGDGRLEGFIAKNNSTALVNFNGTGTTYDGATATCIVNLAANDNIRVKRTSGTAYATSHGNHYFWGRLLG